MPELRPLKVAWILAVASVVLPGGFLYRDLSPVALFFLGGVLLWIFLRERQGDLRPLGVRDQILLLLPFLFWTILTLRLETLVVRFADLLLILAGVKFLGTRTPRDILQIYLLGLLLLVAAAVWRFDLLYGALFALETALLISGLLFLFAAQEGEKIPLALARRLAFLGVLTTLGVFVLTAFYFLFLPRPQYTLFSGPFGSTVRTGLSDRVAPGEIAALQEDPSVAFRVRWLSGPRPARPYFRVYVYGNYHRGVWTALRKGRGGGPRSLPGPRARVEILPQVETRALPVPGYPLEVETVRGPVAEPGPEGTVVLKREVLEPSLWRLTVVLTPFFPAESPPEDFLRVPRRIRLSLKRLAEGLRRSDPLETARAVEAFLRRNYTYTLSPGPPSGDPLLWFLFSSHRGHCEYFATAMVFLLRTLGIPARVVGGYAGGQWNPFGGYYLLREKDAHTWVEVWIQGKGWMPFDPTPASGFSPRPSPFRRWRLLWDYLQFRWYYWVVEYDFLKQMRLLRHLAGGLGHRPRLRLNPPRLRLPALVILLGPGLVAGVFLLRRRRFTPVERLLREFSRYGWPRRASETLGEYLERVSRERPDLSSELRTFCELYYQEVFGGQDTRAAQKELLSRILRRLRSR